MMRRLSARRFTASHGSNGMDVELVLKADQLSPSVFCKSLFNVLMVSNTLHYSKAPSTFYFLAKVLGHIERL